MIAGSGNEHYTEINKRKDNSVNQQTTLEVPNRLYEGDPDSVDLAITIKRKLQLLNEEDRLEEETEETVKELELLLAAAVERVWPGLECGIIILVDNDTAEVLTSFNALLAEDEDPPAYIIYPMGPDDPRGFPLLLFV